MCSFSHSGSLKGQRLDPNLHTPISHIPISGNINELKKTALSKKQKKNLPQYVSLYLKKDSDKPLSTIKYGLQLHCWNSDGQIRNLSNPDKLLLCHILILTTSFTLPLTVLRHRWQYRWDTHAPYPDVERLDKRLLDIA